VRQGWAGGLGRRARRGAARAGVGAARPGAARVRRRPRGAAQDRRRGEAQVRRPPRGRARSWRVGAPCGRIWRRRRPAPSRAPASGSPSQPFVAGRAWRAEARRVDDDDNDDESDSEKETSSKACPRRRPLATWRWRRYSFPVTRASAFLLSAGQDME
jgi:hypothetical protein